MSKEQTKNLLFLISTSLLVLFSLILLTLSFSVNDDGFGTQFETNPDYAVLVMISCVVFVYSLLVFLKKTNEKTAPISMMVAFSLSSLYSLGVFIKAMVKQKPFLDYQLYFYIGIVTLAFLAYSIYSYIVVNDQK